MKKPGNKNAQKQTFSAKRIRKLAENKKAQKAFGAPPFGMTCFGIVLSYFVDSQKEYSGSCRTTLTIVAIKIKDALATYPKDVSGEWYKSYGEKDDDKLKFKIPCVDTADNPNGAAAREQLRSSEWIRTGTIIENVSFFGDKNKRMNPGDVAKLEHLRCNNSKNNPTKFYVNCHNATRIELKNIEEALSIENKDGGSCPFIGQFVEYCFSTFLENKRIFVPPLGKPEQSKATKDHLPKAMKRRGVDFLQERDFPAMSFSAWQIIYKLFEKYNSGTQDSEEISEEENILPFSPVVYVDGQKLEKTSTTGDLPIDKGEGFDEKVNQWKQEKLKKLIGYQMMVPKTNNERVRILKAMDKTQRAIRNAIKHGYYVYFTYRYLFDGSDGKQKINVIGMKVKMFTKACASFGIACPLVFSMVFAQNPLPPFIIKASPYARDFSRTSKRNPSLVDVDTFAEELQNYRSQNDKRLPKGQDVVFDFCGVEYDDYETVLSRMSEKQETGENAQVYEEKPSGGELVGFSEQREYENVDSNDFREFSSIDDQEGVLEKEEQESDLPFGCYVELSCFRSSVFLAAYIAKVGIEVSCECAKQFCLKFIMKATGNVSQGKMQMVSVYDESNLTDDEMNNNLNPKITRVFVNPYNTVYKNNKDVSVLNMNEFHGDATEIFEGGNHSFFFLAAEHGIKEISETNMNGTEGLRRELKFLQAQTKNAENLLFLLTAGNNKNDAKLLKEAEKTRKRFFLVLWAVNNKYIKNGALPKFRLSPDEDGDDIEENEEEEEDVGTSDGNDQSEQNVQGGDSEEENEVIQNSEEEEEEEHRSVTNEGENDEDEDEEPISMPNKVTKVLRKRKRKDAGSPTNETEEMKKRRLK